LSRRYVPRLGEKQELLKTLSAEENLWIDFNSPLDRLERELPTTRQH
jgi:hypothetical protein